MPVANRNRVETERLIGLFVNTQILRAEFDVQMTFTDFWARSNSVWSRLRPIKTCRSSNWWRPCNQSAALTTARCSGDVQPSDPGQGERRSLPGLELEAVAWDNHTAKFDLTPKPSNTKPVSALHWSMPPTCSMPRLPAARPDTGRTC